MRQAEALGIIRSLIMYYGNPLYLLRMRKFYRRWIGRGSLAFDIGAHVGNRSAVWIIMGARALMVEPQPRMAALLRRSFAPFTNAVVLPSAVGDSSGNVQLAISSRHPTVSSAASDWVERGKTRVGFTHVRWNTTVTVPQVTLQELLQQYGQPDFIKIDIEGGELSALSTLTQAPNALSFEIIPGERQKALDCIAVLERLGSYRYNFSRGEVLRMRFSQWLAADQIRKWLQQPRSYSGDIYAECTADNNGDAS